MRKQTKNTKNKKKNQRDERDIRVLANTKARGTFATGMSRKQERDLARTFARVHGAAEGCTPIMQEQIDAQYDPNEAPQGKTILTSNLAYVIGSPKQGLGAIRVPTPGLGVIGSNTPTMKSFTLNQSGFLFVCFPSFGQPFQDRNTVIYSKHNTSDTWPKMNTATYWGTFNAPGITTQGRYAPPQKTLNRGYEYAKCRGLRVTVKASSLSLERQGGFVTFGQTDGLPLVSLTGTAAWQSMRDSVFSATVPFETISTDVVIPFRPCPRPIANHDANIANMHDASVAPNPAADPLISGTPWNDNLDGGWCFFAIYDPAGAGAQVEVFFEASYEYFGGSIDGHVPVIVDPKTLRCVEACRISSRDYKVGMEASQSVTPMKQVAAYKRKVVDMAKRMVAHESPSKSLWDRLSEAIVERGPSALMSAAKFFL